LNSIGETHKKLKIKKLKKKKEKKRERIALGRFPQNLKKKKIIIEGLKQHIR
jgi:hypothetical protein